MKYNFDVNIDRSGTSAIKLDRLQENWGRTDLIPMWVADMDLATAPFVLDAIRKRCENPILGYTAKPASYFQAIVNWNHNRYGFDITPDMISFVSGIVPGIGLALNAFTEKGDKIMVQPPVYHPFMWLIERNEREVVYNPLTWIDGELHMDLEHFRKQVKGCKVFILCNPHNPGGIVWTEEELQTVARICSEEHVLVFSDEIHADLTLPPLEHRPFATISEEARLNSVTFMSPSKAFNMPGITASHVIIPNDTLRARLRKLIDACELDMGHVFAFTAVEAAYSNGTEWLHQCLGYIQGNIDYVDRFMQEHIPGIRVLRPKASFLLWLDCRDLHFSQEELNHFFVDKAHLALNDGAMFGKEGVGFMRMNVGSPRATIERAMQQLLEAYQSL